jgi:hypothetical protein
MFTFWEDLGISYCPFVFVRILRNKNTPCIVKKMWYTCILQVLAQINVSPVLCKSIVWICFMKLGSQS